MGRGLLFQLDIENSRAEKWRKPETKITLTHKLINHVSALFLEYFSYAVIKFPILKDAWDFCISLDLKLSWLIDWDYWGKGERILRCTGYLLFVRQSTRFFYIYSHYTCERIVTFLTSQTEYLRLKNIWYFSRDFMAIK